jgi:exopolysaccharide biosynthesis polyprenyl glycosylphosphotransferase
MRERPELGLAPVGFLDKEPREATAADGALEVLGASWDLEEVVERHGVEHVHRRLPTAPHAVLLNLVHRCRAPELDVSVVPRLFEEVSTQMRVEHLGGIALLRVDQADPRGWQFEVKYAIDRAMSAVALAALALPLAVIALAVRLGSEGPILFRQARIGLDGQEFDVFKFRTMRMGPAGEENDAAWARRSLGQDESGKTTAPGEDRRTALGTFLRRTSLDELPQLFNVVRGEMSLVGPRPERTGYVRAFEGHVYRYGDRHRVRSGLTGWAQVHGLRGETSLDDRVEWDNYYVENWSPLLDLKILLLTVPAVLAGSRER